MPTHVLGQKNSTLTPFPGTFTSGDEVENKTKGTIVLVLGQAKTVNGAVVVSPVPGSDVYVRPGETSTAITVAGNQELYIRRTDMDMSTTVDQIALVGDLPTP